MNKLYRKKPVIIEAMRFTGPNYRDIREFTKGQANAIFLGGSVPAGLEIATLEGYMIADPGDWIIKGVKGEFYPCKPDIFAATYEPVEDLS